MAPDVRQRCRDSAAAEDWSPAPSEMQRPQRQQHRGTPSPHLSGAESHVMAIRGRSAAEVSTEQGKSMSGDILTFICFWPSHHQQHKMSSLRKVNRKKVYIFSTLYDYTFSSKMIMVGMADIRLICFGGVWKRAQLRMGFMYGLSETHLGVFYKLPKAWMSHWTICSSHAKPSAVKVCKYRCTRLPRFTEVQGSQNLTHLLLHESASITQWERSGINIYLRCWYLSE